MTIYINGDKFTPAKLPISVANAVELYFTHHQPLTRYAIALNQQFVGQQTYASTLMQSGDCLDIFSPIQGG